MHGCMGSKEAFTELLRERGIDTVFRTNDEGRIYGVTFIDHNNKEVYNGSRLGKNFRQRVRETIPLSGRCRPAASPLVRRGYAVAPLR